MPSASPTRPSLPRASKPSLFGTILCATDLSPPGDRAVAVAYGLAGPDSVVHLLHVNDPAVVLRPVVAPVQSYGRGPSLDVGDKKAHEHMRSLVPSHSAEGGVRSEFHVLHDPCVADQIVAQAGRVRADVIVMGTHGRTGFGRTLLGSVAMDVLRKETAPVVLVRHGAPS